MAVLRLIHRPSRRLAAAADALSGSAAGIHRYTRSPRCFCMSVIAAPTVRGPPPRSPANWLAAAALRRH